MKLLTFFIFCLSTAFAGDIYLNCGEGTIDTMEEFVTSSIIQDSRGKTTFNSMDREYTVVYDNQRYEIFISNLSQDGFIRINSLGKGPFMESPVFDGYSCHLNG